MLVLATLIVLLVPLPVSSVKEGKGEGPMVWSDQGFATDRFKTSLE